MADGGDGLRPGGLTAALAPLRWVAEEPTVDPQQAPLAMAYDGRRWSPRREAEPRPAVVGLDPAQSMVATTSVRLVAAGDTLWMLDEYAYRLRRFGADGQRAVELVVGTGVVEIDEGAAAVSDQPAGPQEPGVKQIRVKALPAHRVIHGGAAAPDGRFYLLVTPDAPGGLALDRFDEASGALERIALPFDLRSRVSMATGGDGLYFMPQARSGAGGWLAWHELEEADWQPVDPVSLRRQRPIPTADPAPAAQPSPNRRE